MDRSGNVSVDGVRNFDMGCTLHREGISPKSLSGGCFWLCRTLEGQPRTGKMYEIAKDARDFGHLIGQAHTT